MSEARIDTACARVRLRWQQACACFLLAAFAALAGCGTSAEPTASFVAPQLGNPCQHFECSGHGVCAPDSSGGPACSCDDGFAGTHCERAVCWAGFHWDANHDCVPDQSCAAQPSNPCGAHGACDDSQHTVACQCDVGYGGGRCELCASGFGRNPYGECLQLVLSPGGGGGGAAGSCQANTCSGHGQCDVVAGAAVCGCDVGYNGARCDLCATGFHRGAADACIANQACTPTTCGSHGSCDASTGATVCQCEAGYGGATCGSCAAGFHDPGDGTCTLDEQCFANTCAGHGTCSDSSGSVVCSCASGYAVPSCDSCASGYHRDSHDVCVQNQVCASSSCNGHGSCDASTGVIVCQCAPGYAGAGCASCSYGFHLDGSDACVLNQQCQSGSCPANATCDASTGVVQCACMAGYQGTGCNSCAPSFKLSGGVCVPSDCSHAPACGAHGQCHDNSGAPVCACDAGYAGSLCDQCAAGYHLQGSQCTIDTGCTSTSCDGHGSCTVANNAAKCACDAQYAGAACDSCASGYGWSGPVCRACTTGPETFATQSFPNTLSTCVATQGPLRVSGMTFTSTGGTGNVWECGPDLIYQLPSLHIALEAGTTATAKIAFDSPVVSLSFDYAARLAPLAAELLADGKQVGTITQVNNGMASLTFSFSAPISAFEIRSTGSGTNQIALDNLTYKLSVCQP